LHGAAENSDPDAKILQIGIIEFSPGHPNTVIGTINKSDIVIGRYIKIAIVFTCAGFRFHFIIACVRPLSTANDKTLPSPPGKIT
jgi:hypothetical protein